MNGPLGILGLLTAIGSSFFVVAAAVDLFGGGDGSTETGVLLGLAAFFTATGLVGWKLARHNLRFLGAKPKQPQVQPHQLSEHEVLVAAQAKGGRLSVTELAVQAEVGLEECQRALDDLVAKGAADLLVSEAGAIVYTFPGLLTASPTQGLLEE